MNFTPLHFCCTLKKVKLETADDKLQVYLGEENNKWFQSAASGQLSCQLHFCVSKSTPGHSLKGESKRTDCRQGGPLGYGHGPVHACEWKAGRKSGVAVELGFQWVREIRGKKESAWLA